MSKQREKSSPVLPKGVEALDRPRGGRGYRATIRKGKGVTAHLGLYETPWLAAFAHAEAARLLHREAPPFTPPTGEEPTADQVREASERVRRRLGVDSPKKRRGVAEHPPSAEALLTFFEVTVVGYWQNAAAGDEAGHPGAGLDAAAGRLVEAATLLFWSRSAGQPDPLHAMADLLARRLDRAFRRADLTREVLDDDGDDPWRVARWLVHPDEFPGRRARGFRDEVRRLYAEHFETASFEAGESPPGWASLLGLTPPFDRETVRAAYRARSRDVHPDAGGSEAEFVRLRLAYEEAIAFCVTRGV